MTPRVGHRGLVLLARWLVRRDDAEATPFAMDGVPAPPALLAELATAHPLDQPAALLWPWDRTAGWETVKAVMAAADITSLPASPKGLRHGFGVHAVMCGVPLNLIQKWLGHADIATTAIYTNVLGPEERDVAARMWH